MHKYSFCGRSGNASNLIDTDRICKLIRFADRNPFVREDGIVVDCGPGLVQFPMQAPPSHE